MKDIVEVAKEIRAILKTKFPQTKFSVRCERYSLGESIDIHYKDGAATWKVDAIVNKYEDIDRDEITGEILAGGNRYVHVHREISEDIRQRVEDEVWSHYVEGTFYSRNDFRLSDMVWRKLRESDIVNGQIIEAKEPPLKNPEPAPKKIEPEKTPEQKEAIFKANAESIRASTAIIDERGFHVLTEQDKEQMIQKLREKYIT